ncbi:hypothetical protein GHT06_006341 [Daphnia sinensis]|uniref:Transposable element P transposase-like RNase H domain-containing protein n=1 Tax=Daphnia sinensis TaxID=1820382 RepID=A0AAD5KEF4_9CRUS|nr:hypothetical protein GHT06_006341 [Daphnia sinensis]
METNDTQEESICVEPKTCLQTAPRSMTQKFFPPTEVWTELKLGVCNIPAHRLHLVEAIVVDGCPTVIKSATIDFLQATVTKYMLGKLCDQANTGISNPQTFSTIAEANKMLRDFATQDRCVGISDPAFKDIVRVATASHLHEPEDDTKIWRAKNCHLLAATDSAICVECKSLLPALVMSRYRATKTGKSAANKVIHAYKTKEELQYALNQATRKIKVLERWKKRALARLKYLVMINDSYLLGVFQAKLTLQTILARAQVQSKHGMRYEAEWLLECLLLRIKSLLPLPSCSTLRRLLSGVSCHFGFNTAALKAVEKIVEGKSGKDLSVILTFDEIALTPQPNFNQESLAIDGFVNLSIDPVYNRDEMEHHDEVDASRPEPNISETPVLADHALVFMVRPLLSNWVQPFGVFASAGAASGDDLHRLVIAAIIRLEARGVRYWQL